MTGRTILSLLQSQVQNGDVESQFLLGFCYYFGKQELQPDHAQAVHWFSKAAEQGHGDAQYWLGYCYKSGEGLPNNQPDLTKALEWFRKAARNGNRGARLECRQLERQLVEARDTLLRLVQSELRRRDNDGDNTISRMSLSMWSHGLSALAAKGMPGLSPMYLVLTTLLVDPESNLFSCQCLRAFVPAQRACPNSVG